MTKRTAIYIISAAILVMVLAACAPSNQMVSNFRYMSSWSAAGQPVACDNRDTYIGYSFDAYDVNQIKEWTETYTGVRSDEAEGPFRHRINDSGVQVSGNTVTVENRFKADGGFLPLSANDTFDPNAIVVTPIPADPTSEIGTSKLVLAVTLKNGLTFTSTKNFPIYGNCPSS